MDEHAAKRRKVRKGTHSCWECRRRKIRCNYSSDDATVCISCEARGSACRSQEFADEQSTAPGPERRVSQRLGRLEQLMEKLVERILPDEVAITSQQRPQSPPTSADGTPAAQAIDVFETSTADETPVVTLLGLRPSSTPARSSTGIKTPASGCAVSRPTVPVNAKYAGISKKLHALFPSPRDIDIIVQQNTGQALFISTLFHSHQDRVDGKIDPPGTIQTVPPVTSHPTILAKRLLHLTLCMQHQKLTGDAPRLQMKAPIPETMARIVNTVTHLVTTNDDLVGCVEGLECIILQGFWHANAGNLRKSWLSFRRTLSLAQLMGIDRSSTHAMRWCDPNQNPMTRSSPEQIWYRINFCDRYLSLILGLPVGSKEDSFVGVNDTPMETLEKTHMVLSARIIERNRSKSREAYALTQSIDCDLEAAANSLCRSWWEEPELNVLGTPNELMDRTMRMMLQIHHYCLLTLLHLPYMLRDPAESRYDYSRATCLRASREVLRRFISVRDVDEGAFSCRHVNYAGLISAMTLILGYLGQRPNAPATFERQRIEDRDLVVNVKQKLEHIASLTADTLSRESADIIERLMPIINSSCGTPLAASTGSRPGIVAGDRQCLQLNVPYLGTINIQAAPVANPSSSAITTDTWDNAPSAPSNEVLSSNVNTFSTPQGQDAGLRRSSFNHFLAMEIPTTMASDHLNQSRFVSEYPEPPTPTDTTPLYRDFPDLMADAGDWAFQGVDTTFFSLLQGGQET